MSNSPLTIKKLLNVADIVPAPNTMYFVQSTEDGIFDIYLSDEAGTVVRRSANEQHILQNYITIADVAPALPCKTQLWWSSATAALCIQYEVIEGTYAWVEIIPSFSIPEFAGNGTANTMSRSDHYHYSLRFTVDDATGW